MRHGVTAMRRWSLPLLLAALLAAPGCVTIHPAPAPPVSSRATAPGRPQAPGRPSRRTARDSAAALPPPRTRTPRPRRPRTRAGACAQPRPPRRQGPQQHPRDPRHRAPAPPDGPASTGAAPPGHRPQAGQGSRSEIEDQGEGAAEGPGAAPARPARTRNGRRRHAGAVPRSTRRHQPRRRLAVPPDLPLTCGAPLAK